jgi:hypothetical protein
VHPGGHQPPFQLAQHRAADPAPPPRGRQADPHHPGPAPADRGHRGSDQFLAHHGDHRGFVRADRRDQIGQPEGRLLAAGGRVVPEPDGGIEVIRVEIPDPAGRVRIHGPMVRWPGPNINRAGWQRCDLGFLRCPK